MLAENPVLESMGEDVGVYLLGGGPPFGPQLWTVPDRRELGRSVHRHPAHELRGDVVLRLAASLPDPLIRLAPDLHRALGLSLDDRPQPPRQALAVHRVLEDRVEDCPEDVILTLIE